MADQHRPFVRTWLLAAVELIAAFVVARAILWTDRTGAVNGHHQGMAGVTGMAGPTAR